MILRSQFGYGNDFGQIPVVFSPYCERGQPRFIDGVIWAHSMDDLMECLDRGFMRSMGITWPS